MLEKSSELNAATTGLQRSCTGLNATFTGHDRVDCSCSPFNAKKPQLLPLKIYIIVEAMLTKKYNTPPMHIRKVTKALRLTIAVGPEHQSKA